MTLLLCLDDDDDEYTNLSALCFLLFLFIYSSIRHWTCIIPLHDHHPMSIPPQRIQQEGEFYTSTHTDLYGHEAPHRNEGTHTSEGKHTNDQHTNPVQIDDSVKQSLSLWNTWLFAFVLLDFINVPPLVLSGSGSAVGFRQGRNSFTSTSPRNPIDKDDKHRLKGIPEGERVNEREERAAREWSLVQQMLRVLEPLQGLSPGSSGGANTRDGAINSGTAVPDDSGSGKRQRALSSYLGMRLLPLPAHQSKLQALSRSVMGIALEVQPSVTARSPWKGRQGVGSVREGDGSEGDRYTLQLPNPPPNSTPHHHPSNLTKVPESDADDESDSDDITSRVVEDVYWLLLRVLLRKYSRGFQPLSGSDGDLSPGGDGDVMIALKKVLGALKEHTSGSCYTHECLYIAIEMVDILYEAAANDDEDDNTGTISTSAWFQAGLSFVRDLLSTHSMALRQVLSLSQGGGSDSGGDSPLRATSPVSPLKGSVEQGGSHTLLDLLAQSSTVADEGSDDDHEGEKTAVAVLMGALATSLRLPSSKAYTKNNDGDNSTPAANLLTWTLWRTGVKPLRQEAARWDASLTSSRLNEMGLHKVCLSPSLCCYSLTMPL
jgi:hypothetical protein